MATPAANESQGGKHATDAAVRQAASASLVLGFLAFVGGILLGEAGFLVLPLALAAIATSLWALSVLERSQARHPSKGKARAGFAFGCIGLVLSLAWIAAAVGNRPSRIASHESSAVGSVRTLSTAAYTYRETYPKQGFPPSLRNLGPPAEGEAFSSRAASLIEEKLASGTRSGYRFVYAARDTDGDGVLDAYTIHAAPVTPGETGFRSFFSDESGVIRFNLEGPADEKSPRLQ